MQGFLKYCKLLVAQLFRHTQNLHVMVYRCYKHEKLCTIVSFNCILYKYVEQLETLTSKNYCIILILALNMTRKYYSTTDVVTLLFLLELHIFDAVNLCSMNALATD